MNRWISFILIIAVGILLGVVYGWVINPVRYVDTTPDSLREDYKTDYVLMVAEVFQGDGNLSLAVRRLAILGEDLPVDMVRRAVLFATQAGYAEADVERMEALEGALQTWNPVLEVPTP